MGHLNDCRQHLVSVTATLDAVVVLERCSGNALPFLKQVQVQGKGASFPLLHFGARVNSSKRLILFLFLLFFPWLLYCLHPSLPGERELWPGVGIDPGFLHPIALPSLPCPCDAYVNQLAGDREQPRGAGDLRIRRGNPDGWGLRVAPSSITFWRQHSGSASQQIPPECKPCRLPVECLTFP